MYQINKSVRLIEETICSIRKDIETLRKEQTSIAVKALMEKRSLTKDEDERQSSLCKMEIKLDNRIDDLIKAIELLTKE